MIYAYIKKGSFQDSVSLMLISKKLSNLAEVDEVSIMMGTPANKSLLQATGFWHDVFDEATPNDVCVAIKADSDQSEIITLISEQFEQALQGIAQGNSSGKRLPKARRWQSAQQKLPDANLVLISIAGEYAAELCEQALDDGKNVMIFSDNVSIDDEIKLKSKAAAKKLIVMGPDCGTAIIAGAPLAFSNVINKGVIGIVGASGTGIQELTSQIDLLGKGITHAIGLGGRDLSADIGGISALSALEMLTHDPESKVLAFISKPPAENVRRTVIATMKTIAKPIVALFLGAQYDRPRDGNIYMAATIDEAARLAAMLANVQETLADQPLVTGKKIRGLYTGGTLAAEAAMILADYLGVDADSQHERGSMLNANGHQIVDLGDDFYTVGKPHPMIDPSTRMQKIVELGADTDVGVLLVDVVIGYGANANPAESVIESVADAQRQRGNDQPLIVIATVTGTDKDPQRRDEQIAALRQAGILVMETLPEAVILAHTLIMPLKPQASAESAPLLAGVSVINAGLRSFAEDLQSSNVPVVHYQWAPIAGGNKKLSSLLKKLH
jgi:FdrA protein